MIEVRKLFDFGTHVCNSPFFGDNPEDREDTGFVYRVMNEIFDDADHPYKTLDEMSYAEIQKRADDNDEVAASFKETLEDYPVTVVELSDSALPQEFNLQFIRLNLGQLIISGEKLHAMVGELRDLCFDDLGKHPFLSGIHIPTRRYAREQLAAQIIAQVFALEESKRAGREREFVRIRHLDLQRLFKEHANIGIRDAEENTQIERVRRVLDLLNGQLDNLPTLRSRSIVLSLVLLAYERGIDNKDDARQLAKFASSFVGRLKWQVRRGLDVYQEYRYLIDFQRHLTQASVEKHGIFERARELEESFDHWRRTGSLKGDQEYREHYRKEPEEA